MIRVGVLDVQGDVFEHECALETTFAEHDIEGTVFKVKRRKDFEELDALIIPGGESTTTGKLLRQFKIDSEITKLAAKGVPILGTCTGLILLSKSAQDTSAADDQPLLELMDIHVKRNAFGCQRESFESDIRIEALGDDPFPCVFIRAPIIVEVGSGVKVLSRYKSRAILARQGNLLAAAFHPELTDDTRLHKYFIRMI